MNNSVLYLHKLVYGIGRFVVLPYLRIKYSFTTNRVPVLNEPFILLSNHTTEIDMLFTAAASRHHMYFVCGEHLLRNPNYGAALRGLADPIPIPKGGGTFRAVKEILRRINAGHNICMFPEGKRSFHGETIPSSTALGRLVKLCGCALVTYRIEGGYFTYPRWARGHHRRGPVRGSVVGTYSSDQLKNMSVQEVTDLINSDTYENAYATQRQKMDRYTGNNRAKGIELYLFLCPCCGSMDTIQTEGDSFCCTACGMHGQYNDYGFLESNQLPFDDILSWSRWLEGEFDKRVLESASGTLLFAESDVRLYRMLDNYQNEDILVGNLHTYHDRMEIGDYVFNFQEISSLSLLYGNILLFTCNSTYYGLTGQYFHAWKCGRLWHLYEGDTHDRTKEL